MTYTTLEFVNQKEMVTTGCDFYTFEQKRSIRLDFDFKRKPIRKSFQDISGSIEGIDYEYENFDTEPFDSIEEYEEFRRINENFNCLRTSADWQKFWLRLDDHKTGYKRNLSDMEWTKLFSVIQGYRMGLWDIPEITACGSVTEKLETGTLLRMGTDQRLWRILEADREAETFSRVPQRSSKRKHPFAG